MSTTGDTVKVIMTITIVATIIMTLITLIIRMTTPMIMMTTMTLPHPSNGVRRLTSTALRASFQLKEQGAHLPIDFCA